ncbi:hypothetical protein JCM6882_005683 [Rhodosporidiobolus microsporus]
MSSDSEQEEAPLRIFKGLYFFLHGPNPGLTRNGLAKLIQKGGGKVVDDIGDVRVSHVVLSGNYWAKRKTVAADLTLKRIQQANEVNRTAKDEDYNRVWLLPLDWVQQCLEKEERLSERAYDYERVEKAEKEKEEEAKADQRAEERRGNKGKSKYGRGERVRRKNALAAQKVKKEQAAIEKSGNYGSVNDFTGLPGASGFSYPTYQPAFPPNPYAPAFAPVPALPPGLYSRYPATLGAPVPPLPLAAPKLSAAELFARSGFKALKARVMPIPSDGFKLVNPLQTAQARDFARQLSFFPARLSLHSHVPVTSGAGASSSLGASSAYGGAWRAAPAETGSAKRPAPTLEAHSWGRGRSLKEPDSKKRKMQEEEEEEHQLDEEGPE